MTKLNDKEKRIYIVLMANKGRYIFRSQLSKLTGLTWRQIEWYGSHMAKKELIKKIAIKNKDTTQIGYRIKRK